jgi:hypothetical protein
MVASVEVCAQFINRVATWTWAATVAHDEKMVIRAPTKSKGQMVSLMAVQSSSN